MPNILISYKSDDRSIVQELANELVGQGFSVWWDRNLTGGEAYSPAIFEQLDAADVVIGVWSERAATSDWVRSEFQAAADKTKLIPVRIDQTERAESFHHLHTIDLIGDGPVVERGGFAELVYAVQIKIKQNVDLVRPDLRSALAQAEYDQPEVAQAQEGASVFGALQFVAGWLFILWLAFETSPYWMPVGSSWFERPAPAELPEELVEGADGALRNADGDEFLTASQHAGRMAEAPEFHLNSTAFQVEFADAAAMARSANLSIEFKGHSSGCDDADSTCFDAVAPSAEAAAPPMVESASAAQMREHARQRFQEAMAILTLLSAAERSQRMPEAIRALQVSANAGFAPALNNLGLLYEQGDGLEKNVTRAERLYRRAAAMGSADAQNNLGTLLLRRGGTSTLGPG